MSCNLAKNCSISFLNSTVHYRLIHAPNYTQIDGLTLLTAVILSSASRFNMRNAVRHTWANSALLSLYKFKIIFTISGFNQLDDRTKKLLRNEQTSNGDLIIWDLPETYENLQLKIAVTMKFMTEFGKMTFVLKTDDNVLVSLRTAYKWTECIGTQSTTIHGLCLDNRPTMREGKWTVSRELWPDDVLPRYCLGGAAQIYTMHALQLLVKQFPSVAQFWIEDVWLTGIVAQKANVSRVMIEPQEWIIHERHSIDRCNIGRQLAYHAMDFETTAGTIYNWWTTYVAESKRKCTKNPLDVKNDFARIRH